MLPRGHLEKSEWEHAIEQLTNGIMTCQSQQWAAAQNISAKAVTPFLLGRIFELTEGRSLKANIALVRNNARLAAQIAIALGK